MIIPIAGPLQLAVSFYEVDLSVRDVQYVTTDGQDIWTELAIRTIKAAVDPSNARAIERVFGGAVSTGSMMVITKEILYTGDMAGEVYPNQKQSYITWAGIEYRINEKAGWQELAGLSTYLASRHVRPETGM